MALLTITAEYLVPDSVRWWGTETTPPARVSGTSPGYASSSYRLHGAASEGERDAGEVEETSQSEEEPMAARRADASPLKTSGKALPDPRDWAYDVFVSHTGAQKDLANSLQDVIRSLTLRPFFDLESLQGTTGNDRIMDSAARKAPVSLLLLSPEFFGRRWPLRELAIIVRTNRFLPVWIGNGFDEYARELKRRPPPSPLSEEEWKSQVQTLKYTTTVVQGDQMTVEFTNRVVFLVMKRLVELCVAIGLREDYDSAALQQFRDRLRTAAKRVVDYEALGSIFAKDHEQASQWLNELDILNRRQLRQAGTDED